MKRLSPAIRGILFRLRPATRLVPVAALALFLIAPLLAARGLDARFASRGRMVFTADGDHAHVIAHLPQPTGGSVAVVILRARFGCPSGTWCLRLAWFAANEAYSVVDVPVAANFTEVKAAAIDSQGRVVVVGTTNHSGTDNDFRIVRVTPAGELDHSFGFGGIATVAFDVPGSTNDDRAMAVAIDGDDRIVVAGFAATSQAGDVEFAVARLVEHGDYDLTFGNNGRVRIPFEVNPGRSFAITTALAINSAGRILIGGTVYDLSKDATRIGMARLMPNGAYDTSWCSPECGPGNAYPGINSGRSVPYYGAANDLRDHTVAAIAVNSEGRVAIVGDYDYQLQDQGYVLMLSANGTWNNEKTIVGGPVSHGGRATMGGVVFLPVTTATVGPFDLIVTGARLNGDGWSYFFAQCLRSAAALAPCNGWGNASNPNDPEGSSTVTFYSGMAATDPNGSIPRASTVDRKGRLLMGGSAVRQTLHEGDLFAGTVARIQGEEVLSNGFE